MVVLTKNSSNTLAQCLDAIRRNIDVARLIVLDDSNDGGKTMRIASELADQVLVYPKNIGEKRDHAIDLVDTPVFAFVDSDVIVNRAAFLRSLEMLLNDDLVAAVANAIVPVDPRLRSIARQRTQWSNLKFGFALLRTSVLRKSRIPLIPFGEDGRTGITLGKLGFKWSTQSEYLCWHIMTLQENWFHGRRYARLGYSWISPKKLPLVMVMNLFGIVYPVWVSRRRSLDSFVFCMFIMIGLIERISSGGWPLSVR
ncbi:MAG TPA: glycosyltransferase family 2 protein [Nitrososphaerales archaeon]|nr:glycosyltransferase family 2 protein [Nitrososphaerales archaeon]